MVNYLHFLGSQMTNHRPPDGRQKRMEMDTTKVLRQPGYTVMKTSKHTNPDVHPLPPSPESWFRYLPASADMQQWGSYVVNAGYSRIPPHTPYPPVRHPPEHHFTWESGRTLTAHAFIYVTRGRGTLESEPSGRLTVRAGDVFLLFPGVWHRYRPDPRTGWDEHWVECDGEQWRRRVALHGLRPEQPLWRIGPDERLLRAFADILDILRCEPPDYPLLLGVQAEWLLVCLGSLLKRRTLEGRPAEEIIREARELLTRLPGRRQRVADMASQLNMGHETFRRLFKTYTGFAPRQYALQVGMQRAAQLLTRTRLPVGHIADELGFQSIFYFSRYFKRKFGCSPRLYRQRDQHLTGRERRKALHADC